MVRSEGGAVSVRWRNQEALRRAWGCPWVGHGREQQRHKDRGTEGSVPGSRGPVWLRKEVGRGGQANVASSPGSRPAGGGEGVAANSSSPGGLGRTHSASPTLLSPVGQAAGVGRNLPAGADISGNVADESAADHSGSQMMRNLGQEASLFPPVL